MSYDFNGSNQYLNCSTAPISSIPATIAAWVYPHTTTLETIVSIENASSPINGIGLLIVNSKAWAMSQSVSNVQAVSVTTITANNWWHLCATWESNTLRSIYVNGLPEASDTQSTVVNFSSPRFRIGQRSNLSDDQPLDGVVSNVGVWQAVLTANEIASLAKGMPCDKIRPQSLVFYAPLVRDLIDAKGGLTITNNNSATVADHPRIYG